MKVVLNHKPSFTSQLVGSDLLGLKRNKKSLLKLLIMYVCLLTMAMEIYSDSRCANLDKDRQRALDSQVFLGFFFFLNQTFYQFTLKNMIEHIQQFAYFRDLPSSMVILNHLMQFKSTDLKFNLFDGHSKFYPIFKTV